MIEVERARNDFEPKHYSMLDLPYPTSPKTDVVLYSLWNNNSWREYIIWGSLITAAAVFNLIAENYTAQRLTFRRSIISYGAGFFMKQAACEYTTIKELNNIKTETVELYSNIDKRLKLLEEQFTPAEKHPVIHKIIKAIRDTSKAGLDWDLPTVEGQDIKDSLLLTYNFMLKVDMEVDTLNLSLNQPESVSPQALNKILAFWERGLDSIQADFASMHNEVDEEEVVSSKLLN